MAKEAERTVQQSLLERLTDREPKTPADPPTTFAASVRALKASLRRDIEWLLNSRRIKDLPPEPYEQLRRSLYVYGLPDISSMSKDSAKARLQLLRQVEETLADFEPRLAGVRVKLVEAEAEGDASRRELRFIIEGLIRMDPSPERVVFDTVLEFSSGEYDVRGEGA